MPVVVARPSKSTEIFSLACLIHAARKASLEMPVLRPPSALGAILMVWVVEFGFLCIQTGPICAAETGSADLKSPKFMR